MTDQHMHHVIRLPAGDVTSEPFDDFRPVVVVDELGLDVASVVRSIERLETGGCLTVISAHGALDRDTAPLLSAALWRALCGPMPVCCDLSGVTFFGASAARAVAGANFFASDLGREFQLRGVHGVTRRVLAVVDPGGLIRR